MDAIVRSGRIVPVTDDGHAAFQKTDDVVTERSLRETYGVDVRIIEENLDDVGLLKSCVPVVRYRNDPA